MPEVASLKACLGYLRAIGYREQIEEFVKLVVDKNVVPSAELEELFGGETSAAFEAR